MAKVEALAEARVSRHALQLEAQVTECALVLSVRSNGQNILLAASVSQGDDSGPAPARNSFRQSAFKGVHQIIAKARLVSPQLHYVHLIPIGLVNRLPHFGCSRADELAQPITCEGRRRFYAFFFLGDLPKVLRLPACSACSKNPWAGAVG